MAALTGFANGAQSRVAMVEGKRPSLSVRATSMVFGFAFILAGVGLWLMPGLDLTPYILLSKMGVSILLVTAGVGMTQIATDKPCRELHFDQRNRQLLVMEGLPRSGKHVVKAVNYEDIMRVDVSDRMLQVYDLEGRVSVALPIEGPHARLDTIAQLRSQAILPI
ncbi:hypothetical protein [Shimia marina]|uniref:Uncharacterized protein n=1 Tax=Shimia marina TaxID=321267 RepID=A0A0P1FCG3_9RHOB|nr:hypothetical protein [Shimia marina]CUH53438.1 hypothetical protein SHM7688_02892 [Shimia marina]SFD76921.1 hypothetical protein SAMN04488037_102378 [Shimia marina]